MYRRGILMVILITGLAFGFYFVYLFGKVFFWDNTVFEEEKIYIYVGEGYEFMELKSILTPYLKSISDFTLAAKKKDYINRVKPGKYLLLKGSNNNDIINTLRSKSLTVRVTFNNQERLEDLAGRVAQQVAVDSTALIKAFLDPNFLDSKGFTKENILSMYLPNSYDFFWNTSAENFRNKMWSYYERFWSESRKKKAAAQGLSAQQVINLAAIVQKETHKVDERDRVAGVYLNRLKRKMRLQADPTVIYAMKLKYQNFDTVIRRVLFKDLKIKSPYNTYKYRGLPPGPIIMPDISSIEAVLNPEQHNYLYFVANPNNPGYHLFAKNVKDHNINKKIYTNWLNRNRIYR